MEKAIPPKKFDQERWVIESEDGMTLSVQRSDLMRECRMKPSWCRTIHTFQVWQAMGGGCLAYYSVNGRNLG